MARAKKKKDAEERIVPSAEWWAIQLTPEQKAAARAELEKETERIRATGEYRKVIELHEQRVRERAARKK